MGANYEYKYTDKEYEIMMLKKDVMAGANKGARNAINDSEQQEMNELIESDEEINGGDIDDDRALSDAMDEGEAGDDYDFDSQERSLLSSDEEREQLHSAKQRAAKVNNSFTGPYPPDPTDFAHADKGPNYQFEHLLLMLNEDNESPKTKQAASGVKAAASKVH